MSSFSYGKHTKKHIGIWLNYYMNEDIVSAVKKSRELRLLDTVQRAIIKEYDKENNQVWIEIWSRNLIDVIRKKRRYNVFTIKMDVNEEWSCSGDLGSGINF